MKVKSIYVFPNGNIAVLDENGEQITQLQGNFKKKLVKAVKNLVKNNESLTGKIEVTSRSGGWQR